MIPASIVFIYLGVVLAIGLVARHAAARQPDAEDFFLAGRSLGPAVFLLSLFVAFYLGAKRARDALLVQTGRLFVIAVTVVAYAIALLVPQSIFDLATQYAFAGYAALSPLLVAALFWKDSTRWGALAATVRTAAAVLAVAVLQSVVPAPADVAVPVLSIGGIDAVTRAASGTMVLGLLPVVPMTVISALLMVVVSRWTPGSRPAAATLARYF